MPKVRIYKPHTHAGKRYVPGPDGLDIEVADRHAAFLERSGVLTAPAIGTRPQAGAAGEGTERRNAPAAGNVATNADDNAQGAPAADAEADMPASTGGTGGAGTGTTAAGGSVSVATDDPTVTRTVSPAGAVARQSGADSTVTRNTTPPARTGKK